MYHSLQYIRRKNTISYFNKYAIGGDNPRRINPVTDPVGSDQPTKSDGIPGNESTNGSDRSALFSLYVLVSILVNTTEELYTTIISYRIPIVGPNQIRWKILH